MLPLEVFSEIFYLVNESQDENDFHALPAPFLLGRICRSWRHHVQSRPRMWSAITIHLSPSNYPAQEQLVQEWLIRSGDYDLHYNISSRDKWIPPSSFVNLILQTSSRWKTFKTVASFSISREVRNGALFPRLSSIVIDVKSYENPSSFDFSPAQELKHLTLPSGCPTSMALSWPRLLTFMGRLTLRPALPMIERLEKMQKMHLKINPTTTAATPALPSRVLLRYLSNVDIKGDGVAISTCLDSIATPALTFLRVSSSVIYDTAQWTDSLVELHKRSPFWLTALTLHSLAVTEAAYVEMLRFH